MNLELKSLFERDLDLLYNEIKSFNSEEDLWKTTGSIVNSAGNLTLHICGNLLHFLGATIGNNGYVRDRDKEFNDKNIPRDELLDLISHTKQVVGSAIDLLDDDQWKSSYPIPFRNETVSVQYFLVHLYGHMQYHFGQINYLRRGFFE